MWPDYPDICTLVIIITFTLNKLTIISNIYLEICTAVFLKRLDDRFDFSVEYFSPCLVIFHLQVSDTDVVTLPQELVTLLELLNEVSGSQVGELSLV